MRAIKLEGGDLFIPKRAEARGLVGDGYIRISPDAEEYADWLSTAENVDVKLGGPGSGNYGHRGVPGQVGGSARSLRYVPSHVWERAGQRATYRELKEAIVKIKELEVFPRSKKQSWHISLPGGILVGSNAAAQTFLAPTMTVKEGSTEIQI